MPKAEPKMSVQLERHLKRSEKTLQQSIVEVLEMHGWTVLEYAKPGARGPLRQMRAIMEAAGMSEQGVKTILSLAAGLGGRVPEGHTDLVALKAGFPAWYIEVKLPGRHPTPEQGAFWEYVRQGGTCASYATCIEDVQDMLRYLGDEVRVEVR